MSLVKGLNYWLQSNVTLICILLRPCLSHHDNNIPVCVCMHVYWMVSRSSSFSIQAERSDGAKPRVFPYPLNNDVRKD